MLFSDDFELGDLSRWASVDGLVVENHDVHGGSWAAEAAGAGVAADAVANLSQAAGEVDVGVWFNVSSHSTGFSLLKFKSATGATILAVGVRRSSTLRYVNGVTGVTHRSTTVVAQGVWHQLNVHLSVNGASGTIAFDMDGQPVDMGGTDDLGSAAIGRLLVGTDTLSRTFDVSFDDVTVTTPGAPPPPPVDLLGIASQNTYQVDAPRIEGEIGTVPAWRKYERFSSTLASADTLAALSAGKTVVLSWKPDAAGLWSNVTAGLWDAKMTTALLALKPYADHVILIFHHEPDNDDSQYGTSADFIAAFQHVATLARSIAPAIRMAYVATCWNLTNAAAFYPGDAYVDIIGCDIYNWGTDTTKSNWKSLQDAASAPIAWAKGYGKPVILGEWGSQAATNDPNGRAAWLTAAAKWLRDPNTGILLACYFDVGPPIAAWEWRFETAPQDVAAMHDAWS